MGLLITIGRCGTVIASYMLPLFYKIRNDITHPLLFGAILCCVSLALSLVLITIDKFNKDK